MSAPRLALGLVLVVALLAPGLTLARPARAQETGWASEFDSAKASDYPRAQARGTHDADMAIPLAVEDAPTSSWSPLVDGNELNHGLYALVFDDTGRALYAAGRFTSAGGVSATHIAKWDGTAWSPLGRGTDFPIYGLALDDAGNLYAGGGGWYDLHGESLTDHIAKWDGENWSSLGSMNGSVRALAWDSVRSLLYAAGWFTTVDGISANHIATWNGAAWSPLGSGLMYEGVAALAMDSSRSRVYVGGWFGWAGGVSATRTAMWDARTSSWSALGSGMNESVNTLALDSDGQTLYAGGEFTTAGASPANYLARWRPAILAPIEQPSAGAIVTGAVTLTGFAIDLTSPSGTGIDSVRVYLDGPSGAGALIGQATYGVSRPDIAALYGARFGPSGWELDWNTNGLAPGVHRLYVYAHRTTDNDWSPMPPHQVVVCADHGVWLPLVARN